MDDLRRRTGHLQDDPGQIEHGVLVGVPDVHGTGDPGVEQGQDAGHLVVDETEAPGLATVAVDGEGPAVEGLGQEVGDDPAVAGPKPGPVGVEDPDDPDVGAVGPVPGHGEGLGETLGLVVDAAGPDRVHVPPVGLGLGMDGGVAVDLAGGGQDEPGPVVLGQLQSVAGPLAAHGQSLEGTGQIVGRRGRAGEMEDGVHRTVDVEGHADVGHQELEEGSARSPATLPRPSGGEVVDADHPVTPGRARASHRWDPRNPAPPVTTTLPPPPSVTRSSRTADADVGEPHPPQRAGSRRLRASTTDGSARWSRTLAKSSQRNSSHSVRTTTASAPSQAA